jgi:murein DD-endopeptidase MepM/ murein hydrolase activator NlpD
MGIRICSAIVSTAAFFSALVVAPPVFAATTATLSPPKGCDLIGADPSSQPATIALMAAFPPTQLDVRTPLEPTVLPSGGRNYLIYELHLRNFTEEAMHIRRIEVIAGRAATERALAVVAGTQLNERVRLVGPETQDAQPHLAAGQSAVAYLCLAFDAAVPVPEKLRHRLVLDGATADGPEIDTHHTPLKVLGRPLAGENWSADNGPSIESHHRMGLFVAGGAAQISRRYAFDWKIYQSGRIYSGDERDVRSYFSYGRDVLAVADGEVVQARDGMPDNIPRTKAGFTPAIPITMDTVAGNFIVIALGDGQFAQYAHLQPGSLRVKSGDRVKRGEVVARVGGSGDARVPHLHFQVADKPDIFASEGLPYLLDRYRLKNAEGEWERRTREFPPGDGVIDFGLLSK